VSFNAKKFEKIWELVERGEDGESVAAFLRIKEIAKKNNITIKEAVKQLATSDSNSRYNYSTDSQTGSDSSCSNENYGYYPQMTFGKWRGHRINEIPWNYLQWLLSQDWFHEKFSFLAGEIKKYMQKESM